MKSPFFFTTVMLISSAWLTCVGAKDSTSTGSTNEPPSLPKITVPPLTLSDKPDTTGTAPVQAPASNQKSSYKAPLGKIPGDQKGSIEKVDADGGTLTVAGKTFKVPSKCKVYVGDDLKALGDLKEGDLVAVTFWEEADGSLRASLIIKGSRTRAKAKKATPEEAAPKKE